eukprot:SAG31_NODE_3079_length_4706_cov_3.887779_2_plen_111_part_00
MTGQTLVTARSERTAPRTHLQVVRTEASLGLGDSVVQVRCLLFHPCLDGPRWPTDHQDPDPKAVLRRVGVVGIVYVDPCGKRTLAVSRAVTEYSMDGHRLATRTRPARSR